MAKVTVNLHHSTAADNPSRYRFNIDLKIRVDYSEGDALSSTPAPIS